MHACNIISLLHLAMFSLLQFDWSILVESISNLTCSNTSDESHLQSLSSLWTHFHRHCINVDWRHSLFNWHDIAVVFCSLKFSMFFTFYSSSSSITIESDDSFHCSFREFFKFNRSRFKVNSEWIFIVDDSFSWYACSILIRILKDSSILSFSFFDDLAIIVFLEFRNIMSFIL